MPDTNPAATCGVLRHGNECGAPAVDHVRHNRRLSLTLHVCREHAPQYVGSEMWTRVVDVAAYSGICGAGFRGGR